jgi:alkaline phosphatase D
MSRILKAVCVLVLMLLFGFSGCKRDPEIIGEYAPKDAYLEGSKHPYYGSENAWNRRFFYDHIKDYYKRRGQRQMLDIVEGRAKEAAKYCRKLLKENPQDQESLFNLVVAYTQMKDIPSAMEAVKRAVDTGLPVERFFAGPRELLRPLLETEAFRDFTSDYDVSLIHGPMVGCVTDRSAKFWVRTAEEAEVQVMASTYPNLRAAKRSNLKASKAQNDYTAIVEVKGLKAGRHYFYNVVVDGKPIFDKEYPSFRTYPKKTKGGQFSVGFGGGGGFVLDHEYMWNTVHSHDPIAFLFMGDNVYINMPEMPNGVHYYTYYRRQSRPEFRRFVASSSIYAIWDDHDAATDDTWLGPYKDKPAWKLPLLEVFRQNWINPGYGTQEWPGCWHSFSIADVDFFMLDGRFYRTNPYDVNPTMLGPDQKEWLKKELKKSTGTFKVIASPVPWALATKGEARDTWNGFKEERQEIFDFLAENRMDGVILISADRHRSDAWKIERSNGYPLYEFESSRLTNQHVHELMPNALFGYNEKQSFGLLTFDTTISDPAVTYQIVSIDNETIHTFTVKRSEISHAE